MDAVNCDHCGLPVPAGLIEDGAEHQFCCSGCTMAWQIIHEHGFDGYYDLRARLADKAQPALGKGRAYAEFDDPAFAEHYVRSIGDGRATVELYLEGIHCAACVWLVERVPIALPGVAEIRLDLGRSLAVVTWSPDAVPLSTIARFLDGIGYPPHAFRGVSARDIARRERRSLLVRIAVAGALAANVMMLAFALYGGYFHGIADDYRRLFRWLSLALTIPAVGWCALPFFRGALGALRTRTLHMDLPIAVGISAGFLQGAANTVFDRGEIYFESVTALIFLLLVGRAIQKAQQQAAASASELLFSLSPSTARLIEADGAVREVPVEALVPGAMVEVRAGDTVPADGVVQRGRSSLDRSLLTGESRPEPVAPGDPVHAGTINTASPLAVQVRSTGEDTRIGRLMRLVEGSARKRAPVVLLADRISGWFVATVLILAFGTAIYWFPRDPEHAIEHAVALLIVSCPCALGLATPLAISAALAAAARVGILVKNGAAFEVLARSGVMLLDKTGTVTTGRLSVVRWWGPESSRALVAALESGSTHPVARALAEGSGPTNELQVTGARQLTGAGISGTVDGHAVAAGSPAFVREYLGRGLDASVAEEIDRAAADALTPIVIAIDGRAANVAALGDPMRPETPPTLHALRLAGWPPRLLSGDHPVVVEAVARSAGLPADDALGGITPEGKVELVQEAASRGNVAMVGDGVNDAAALAAATVGIGVHGGAEAALAAADVYLTRPGIAPIIDLIEGARRTLTVIRRNLVLSLTYNVVAAAFAISGHMSPIFAAVLMPLSSITVVVSSYRARTFDRTHGHGSRTGE